MYQKDQTIFCIVVEWLRDDMAFNKSFKISINQGKANRERSEVIQRFLFKNGCTWIHHRSTEVRCTEYPFIYVRNGRMTVGSDPRLFASAPLQLVDMSGLTVE